MIGQKFKLYEELKARINANEEFYLIIVSVIDSAIHKKEAGNIKFSYLMNHVGLWALQSANNAMLNKTILAFEYSSSQIALVCLGQTSPHIRSRFTSLLAGGYRYSTPTTSYLLDVSYKVSIFNGLDNKTPQELLNEIEPAELWESINNDIFGEKYTFSKLDLVNAMNNNELELWFQTKVDLKTSQEIGVEALLRWRHPKHGIVSPLEMLGWFKFYSLQYDLDKWVIATAFKYSQKWCCEGTGIQIAVNIDGLSLNHPRCNLVGFIRESAAQFDINPDLIEFEITETQIIEKDSRIYHALMDISSQGFSIAIDDFGTGASNINYLTYLPINTIKLDRFFCYNLHYQDLDIRSIFKLEITKGMPKAIFRKMISNDKADNRPTLSMLTRTTVDLLLSTNYKIVAEGIETHEQAVIMRSLGCNVGQGYYYGRPEQR